MRIRNWVLLLAIPALASCGAPHQLIRVAPEKNNITGVQSALHRAKRADVVFVHGVCYHDQEWVFGINDSLAHELGLSWKMNDQPTPIGDDGGELYVNELSGPAGVVRTFAIVWAPVTTKVKKSLCYDSTETNKVCDDPKALLKDKRVWANALLKNRILDECLADAIYYVGKDGNEKLRRTIEDGLLRALAGGKAPSVNERRTLQALRAEDSPLFIVTQSLGSKMLLDTLSVMASQNCESFTNLAYAIGRTNQVFMEANQIPILALAHNPVLKVPCPGRLAARSASGIAVLATLYEASPPHPQSVSDRIKIAAFSDPNDVLSYTLLPVKDQTVGHEVVDIVTGNDWTYFGVLEDPYAAHTTYGDNPIVKRVLACGSAGLNGACPEAGKVQ